MAQAQSSKDKRLEVLVFLQCVVFILSHGDLTRMGIRPEVLDIVVWRWIINMAYEKLFYERRNPIRQGNVKETIEE